LTCPTPLQPTIPRSRWLAALLLAAAEAELPMQVERVGPHSHCVRGQLALGSSANQNFISDASFVVTHTSVAVIDAQARPGWPSASGLKSACSRQCRSPR